VRLWSVVSVALLVGVFMAALALTTGLGSVSPRPADAAGVNVSVACKAAPEKTRVENNTNHRITVKKVGSIHQPRSNEPFRVNVKLGRGQAVTFESGYDANGRALTRQYIYDNEAGRKEGARVRTSVGGFVDRC
jgi:hypothetical protein